jgi:hypothetical protein
MRIRKAVITVTLAAAALTATAASPALAAPATAAATSTPYVGHNVGGGLLTTHSLRAGQVINLVGSPGGRISNYRVTAEQNYGEVYYVTVWPRLQTGGASLVLFTASN